MLEGNAMAEMKEYYITTTELVKMTRGYTVEAESEEDALERESDWQHDIHYGDVISEKILDKQAELNE
jgi:hypothetical protein